jgi:transcriptional regulator with XRE-family HTH domain
MSVKMVRREEPVVRKPPLCFEARAEECAVPKHKVPTDTDETFGQRLARLRKEHGYSQRDLAAELDISQRMLAYYESQSEHPPTKLLPRLVEVLGVTADELLGISAPKQRRAPDGRLWRRFKELEQLPAKQRRQVVQIVDAFLERERLRKKAGPKLAG